MVHHLPIICVLLLSFTLGTVRAEDTRSLDSIHWILGDWIQTGEQTTTRETWSKLHSDVFKGMGTTTATDRGEKKGEESMLLVEMSGVTYLIAKVKHNKYPVPFELTSCTKKQAVFENADHDFPKKLVYRLVASNALHVVVSGGGQSFTIRYEQNKEANERKE